MNRQTTLLRRQLDDQCFFCDIISNAGILLTVSSKIISPPFSQIEDNRFFLDNRIETSSSLGYRLRKHNRSRIASARFFLYLVGSSALSTLTNHGIVKCRPAVGAMASKYLRTLSVRSFTRDILLCLTFEITSPVIVGIWMPILRCSISQEVSFTLSRLTKFCNWCSMSTECSYLPRTRGDCHIEIKSLSRHLE